MVLNYETTFYALRLRRVIMFRNEKIAKLQQDLTYQKQDQTVKLDSVQEKAVRKQKELQTAVEKVQSEKMEADSNWRKKIDVSVKNHVAKQHELAVDNRRLVVIFFSNFKFN